MNTPRTIGELGVNLDCCWFSFYTSPSQISSPSSEKMVKIDSTLHDMIVLGPARTLDPALSERPAKLSPCDGGEGSTLEPHHRAYIRLLEQRLESKDKILRSMQDDHQHA